MSIPKIYEVKRIDLESEIPEIAESDTNSSYFIDNGSMIYAGIYYQKMGEVSKHGWMKGGGDNMLYEFKHAGLTVTKYSIYLGTLTNEIKEGNYIVYENDLYAVKIIDIKDKDKKSNITVSRYTNGSDQYIVSSKTLKPRTFIQKGINLITLGMVRGGKTKCNKHARKPKNFKKHRRSRKHSKKHT